MIEWAKEHPFLTFMLAGAAIAAPASIIAAARAPAQLTPAQQAAIDRDKLRSLTQAL
jgi:hypothetical protein